jgi:hypothetical protein
VINSSRASVNAVPILSRQLESSADLIADASNGVRPMREPHEEMDIR